MVYQKWLDIGLLQDLSLEEGVKLANYLEDCLKLIDFDNNNEDALFPVIIRRLFMKNNDLNIEEIYDTLNKFYQTIEYKGLKAEVIHMSYLNIDAEAELLTFICENYEEIKEKTRN